MGAQLAIVADLETRTSETSHAPCETRCEPHPGAEPSEEAIRQRSRLIWEREGCPGDRAEEHWIRARAELVELQARTSNAHLERRADVPQPVPAIAPSAPTERTPDPARTAFRDKVEQALTYQAASPAADETVSIDSDLLRLPRPVRSNQSMPCIISAGVELRGTLEAPGDIQFGGCLEGVLCGASVVVEEEAIVEGDVLADDVTVRGHVRGRICARRVVLSSGCQIEGDILYGMLSVENGAQLDCCFQPSSAGDID
jgi:cytoskeletal protein CcmA (bactofilin family)